MNLNYLIFYFIFLLLDLLKAQSYYFYDPQKLIYPTSNSSFYGNIESAFDAVAKSTTPVFLKIAAKETDVLVITGNYTFPFETTIESVVQTKLRLRLRSDSQLRIPGASTLLIRNISIEFIDVTSRYDGLITVSSGGSLKLEGCALLLSETAFFGKFIFAYNSKSIFLLYFKYADLTNGFISSLIFGSAEAVRIEESVFSNLIMISMKFFSLTSSALLIKSSNFIGIEISTKSSAPSIVEANLTNVTIYSSSFSNNKISGVLIRISKGLESTQLTDLSAIMSNCNFSNNKYLEGIFSLINANYQIDVSGGTYQRNEVAQTIIYVENNNGLTSIKNLNFDENFSQNIIYLKFLKIATLALIKVSKNNKIEKNYFDNGGSSILLENIIDISIDNVNMTESTSNTVCPGLIIFQSSLISGLETLFPNDKMKVLAKNLKFIDLGFGQANTGGFPAVALYIEVTRNYTFEISDVLIEQCNRNITGYFLTQLQSKLSLIKMVRIEMRANSKLFSLMNLYCYSSFLSSSKFTENTGLDLNLLNYVVNNMLDVDNIYSGNSAFVSQVEFNPYDKSSFQYYTGQNLLFQYNTVVLFGSAIHFKPTYNGNYTLLGCRFLDSQSYYMSGVIDIFCTNPTFQPTFYIFINTIFSNNTAPFEGGTISYFFHDTAYTSIVENCSWLNNYGGKGGSIMLSLDNQRNTINFINCKWIDNSAEGGGAFSTVSGTINLIGCIFSGNKGERGGTLEAINYNIMNLKNVQILNSYAKKYGGSFLSIDNSNLNLNNVTISNSVSKFGGVFYLDAYSSIEVIQTTIATCEGDSGTLLFISKSQSGVNSLFQDVTITNLKAKRSGFFIDFSNIILKNIKINSYNSTLFALSSSNLTTQSSNFYSGSCDLNQEGCFINAHTQSLLRIELCILSGITTTSRGGILYLLNSEAYIYGGKINNIISEEEATIAYSEWSSIVMNNTVFTNIESDFFKIFYAPNVVLDGIIFNNSQKTFVNDNFYSLLDSCNNLLISKVRIHSLRSNKNGGFLYITNTQAFESVSHIIQDSEFNTIEGDSGGVFYVDNDQLIVKRNKFINNKATSNGGVIYYTCNDYQSNFCDLLVEENSFEMNSAGNHGGVLQWKFKQPKSMLNNTFLGNKAKSYGDNIASFPCKIDVNVYVHDENLVEVNHQGKLLFSTFENPTEAYKIDQISSGQKIPLIFEFFLSDGYNQTIYNLPEAKMYVDILINDVNQELQLSHRFDINNVKHINYTSDLVDIAGQTSQNIDPEKSNFVFDDITVTASPTSTVFLLISTSEITTLREDLLKDEAISVNHYNSLSKSYFFTIPLTVRPCESGEIYENTSNTCYQCPVGTYSLEPFKLKCENCLDNANCYGGRNISVNPGYWRPNNDSLNIYKCKSDIFSCKGGYNSICEEGYEGILCEVCKTVEGTLALKNYFGKCQKCEDIGISFLFIILVLVVFLFLLRIVTRYLVRAREGFEFDFALLKILILHYQMLTLIPNVNLNVNETPNHYLGSLTRNWFALDCMFDKMMSFESILNSRMLCILIFLLIIFLLSNLLYYQYQKRRNDVKHLKFELVTYNSLILFLIQTSMVDLAFLGVRCIEVEGKNYSRYMMNYRCWTSDHVTWTILIYLPNIIFWTFLLPYLFFYVYKKMRLIDKKYVVIASVGFKKKYRFWGDAVNVFRKLIIIVISTFSNENSQTIPFTIFLITSFLLLLHFYFRPYNFKGLNSLDAFSLYIAFSTYYTLSYYYTAINRNLADFFYSFLIIMNIIFIIVWLGMLFRGRIVRFLKMKGFNPPIPTKIRTMHLTKSFDNE